MASTVLAEDGQVKVYDSIYRTLDHETVSFQTFSMNQPGKNWFRSIGRLAGRIVECMHLLFRQLLLFVMILLRSNSINLQ